MDLLTGRPAGNEELKQRTPTVALEGAPGQTSRSRPHAADQPHRGLRCSVEPLTAALSVAAPPDRAYRLRRAFVIENGGSARKCTGAGRILEALDGDGAAGPACAQTAQISLDTYGNVLGDAAEDEGDWPDDLAGLLIKAYSNPKTAKPFQVLFFGTSGTDGLRRFPPEAA